MALTGTPGPTLLAKITSEEVWGIFLLFVFTRFGPLWQTVHCCLAQLDSWLRIDWRQMHVWLFYLNLLKYNLLIVSLFILCRNCNKYNSICVMKALCVVCYSFFQAKRFINTLPKVSKTDYHRFFHGANHLGVCFLHCWFLTVCRASVSDDSWSD